VHTYSHHVFTLPTRSGRPTIGAVNPDGHAVHCIGLTKSFGGVEVVSNVNLELARGDILALLGPSGGGKTTTLRLIAGFETPDSGTIEVEDDIVVGPNRLLPPEKRRVGMVFQDYALFPHMNVVNNVRFGLPKDEGRDKRVAELLDIVGLTNQALKWPHELSGGQQQRVALARALAPNPAVVLMDEPFSNLDAALRDMVRTEVKQILRNAKASAIFVTHDQDEAFGLADQVAIMLGSTVVQTGTPEQVYVAPINLDVARFLGEVDILDGEASRGWATCEIGRLQLQGSADLTGPVKIAIRPESLRLHPDSGPSAPATVVGSEFRGIYKLVKVRLASGITLNAVMGLHISVNVGDDVQVGVNSTVTAFRA
jgi:iron(III) transport system ATP-binding protein